MQLPRPKSAPGILLYFVTVTTLLLVGRVLWVLVGQNVEVVAAERGYDKLLSRHWSEIMNWLASNGFWLSLCTAAFFGATVALWMNVAIQGLSRRGRAIATPVDSAIVSAKASPAFGPDEAQRVRDVLAQLSEFIDKEIRSIRRDCLFISQPPATIIEHVSELEPLSERVSAALKGWERLKMDNASILKRIPIDFSTRASGLHQPSDALRILKETIEAQAPFRNQTTDVLLFEFINKWRDDAIAYEAPLTELQSKIDEYRTSL
jgi:hypothetical protein